MWSAVVAFRWARKKIEKEIRKEADALGFDGRFGPGLPRVSDGSLLFLLHLGPKMSPAQGGGRRVGLAVPDQRAPLGVARVHLSMTPLPDPYARWVADFPALAGAAGAEMADPDGDGPPHLADLAFGQEVIALDLDAGDAEPVGDREALGEKKHTHHRRAHRGADLDEDERPLEPRALFAPRLGEPGRPEEGTVSRHALERRLPGRRTDGQTAGLAHLVDPASLRNASPTSTTLPAPRVRKTSPARRPLKTLDCASSRFPANRAA